MSKKKQIVVDETVDTLIDIVWELVTDYMYEYGEYEESDDKFYSDNREIQKLVVEELNKRINKIQKLCMKHQNTGKSGRKRIINDRIQ